MVQWIRKPTAGAGFAAEEKVQYSAWHRGSGLKDCVATAACCSYSSNLISGLGTSICHGCGCEKKINENMTSVF